MFAAKAKIVTVVLLLVGVAGTGAGTVAYQRYGPASSADLGRQMAAAAPQEPIKPPAAHAKPQAAGEKAAIVYSGRVLGSDGRPVPGANLYMTLAWGYPHWPSPSPELATTGAEGRFRFTVPKAQFGDQFTCVAASAVNHGVGWVDVPPDGKKDDLT